MLPQRYLRARKPTPRTVVAHPPAAALVVCLCWEARWAWQGADHPPRPPRGVHINSMQGPAASSAGPQRLASTPSPVCPQRPCRGGVRLHDVCATSHVLAGRSPGSAWPTDRTRGRTREPHAQESQSAPTGSQTREAIEDPYPDELRRAYLVDHWGCAAWCLVLEREEQVH